MVDLYEDDPDLFVAGLAAGNQRVAVSIIDQLLISPFDFSISPAIQVMRIKEKINKEKLL